MIHGLPAHADRPKGSLVHQVGQVRAYGTGSGLGDLLQVHVLGQLDFPGVDLQGVQTALEIGIVYNDPSVEPTGPQQGLVQNFRAVGSGQAHNALGGLKAVDLTQPLIQGLLLLGVVSVAVVPGAAHGIDLVNKDDTGGHLGGLLEQVPYTAGTHAHEHLYKVGAGHGEEGHPRFPCHGLCKQRLAGAGRAHKEGTLGELGADIGIALGIVEEVDDLLQGLLGLVLSGHILKGNAGLLLHIHLGLALAKAAHHAVAAHSLGQVPHEHEENGKGNAVVEHHQDNGVVLLNLLVHGDSPVRQLLRDGQPVSGGHTGVAGPLLGGRFGRLIFGQVIHPVPPVLDLCQLVMFHSRAKIREFRLGVLAVGYHIIDPTEQQHQSQSNDQRRPEIVLGPVRSSGLLFIGSVILS